MTKAKLLNILERALWTFVQGLTADAILTVWEQFRGPIDNKIAWIMALTPILSALKTGIVQAIGNESGATLPESVAPVLPDRIVAVEKDGKVVASNASVVENGKAVEVWPLVGPGAGSGSGGVQQRLF